MGKLKSLIFSLISVIIGIAIIAGGIYMFATRNAYDSTVSATIVDVEEEWQSGTDGDADKLVKTFYIDYEINGKKYEHIQSPVSEDSLKVGDTVEILYQSKNPDKIAAPNISKKAFMIIAAGAVFFVVGLVLFFKSLIAR
jgi:hypothetical protein